MWLFVALSFGTKGLLRPLPMSAQEVAELRELAATTQAHLDRANTAQRQLNERIERIVNIPPERQRGKYFVVLKAATGIADICLGVYKTRAAYAAVVKQPGSQYTAAGDIVFDVQAESAAFPTLSEAEDWHRSKTGGRYPTRQG